MTKTDYLEFVIDQAEARLHALAVAAQSVAESLPPNMELARLKTNDAPSVAYGIYYDLLALIEFLQDAVKAPYKENSPE